MKIQLRSFREKILNLYHVYVCINHVTHSRRVWTNIVQHKPFFPFFTLYSARYMVTAAHRNHHVYWQIEHLQYCWMHANPNILIKIGFYTKKKTCQFELWNKPAIWRVCWLNISSLCASTAQIDRLRGIFITLLHVFFFHKLLITNDFFAKR